MEPVVVGASVVSTVVLTCADELVPEVVILSVNIRGSVELTSELFVVAVVWSGSTGAGCSFAG